MKNVIFAAICIFAFCFAAFAQTNLNQSKATKISEYWEDAGSEEVKFSTYYLFQELQKSQSSKGIIKIQSKERKQIYKQLRKIRFELKFGQVDLTRISFALNNKGKEIVQYWFVPLTENIPDCEDCIIIKAEDYDKLTDFFHPKPKLKKRKK